MAVILQHLCDHPAHGDEQVPGQPQAPMIVPGSRKPKVVDLCGEHEAELVSPLVELFMEHGRVVDLTTEAPRAVEPTVKEVCGYRGCKEKFPAGQPMSTHRRKKHGIGPKK